MKKVILISGVFVFICVLLLWFKIPLFTITVDTRAVDCWVDCSKQVPVSSYKAPLGDYLLWKKTGIHGVTDNYLFPWYRKIQLALFGY